jgi:hypothetical protein
MGYRSTNSDCIVLIIPLRGLSAQQKALCLFVCKEAGHCWTDMLKAHIESQSGKWLASSSPKKIFKCEHPLHARIIRGDIEAQKGLQ